MNNMLYDVFGPKWSFKFDSVDRYLGTTSRTVNSCDEKEWKYQIDMPGVDPATVKVELKDSKVYFRFDGATYAPLVDESTYDFDKLEVVIKHGRLTAKAPRRHESNNKGRKIEVKIE